MITGQRRPARAPGVARQRAPEIAETIARTAVEVLLDRIPDIGLAVPADVLRWKETPIVRGLESLPVTFTPAVTR